MQESFKHVFLRAHMSMCMLKLLPTCTLRHFLHVPEPMHRGHGLFLHAFELRASSDANWSPLSHAAVVAISPCISIQKPELQVCLEQLRQHEC